MPDACPLCGRDRKMRRPKKLYGHNICRTCYYKFTNRRQLAFLIDIYLTQLVAAFVVGWIASYVLVAFTGNNATMTPLGGFTGSTWGFGFSWGFTFTWAIGLSFAFLFLPIFLCKDGLHGHSPGKALCGVRVVHVDTGKPMGFRASLLRNLPLIIPFVVLFVAWQMSRGQRLGDKWAHTRVIWKKYAEHPVFGGPPVAVTDVGAAPNLDLDNTHDDGNPFQSPVQ